MEEKIKLSVIGFSFSQTQSGAYGLVLAEDIGIRRLMIVVGTPEAQSIAFHLQGVTPPRPLTHDLFPVLLEKVGTLLMEIIVYKYENGIFFARMIFKQGDYVFHIESRTSDAIGVALRTGSPIFTTESIMKEHSIVLDELSLYEKEEANNSKILDYSLMNEQELETLLKEAVDGEDYELASLLRDELSRKSKSK